MRRLVCQPNVSLAAPNPRAPSIYCRAKDGIIDHTVSFRLVPIAVPLRARIVYHVFARCVARQSKMTLRTTVAFDLSLCFQAILALRERPDVHDKVH